MSRTSKIPLRHQDRQFPVGDCTFSIIAEPRSPKGITTPEQADLHREAALAKRNTRRVGKTIEEREPGYIGNWAHKQGYQFINEAKRANRPIAPAKAH